ncbi:DMT family transporter [Dickeya zeae]|uniref:DMT family transporter n=1 Tax=Dickeya zeae TaxID=204042 RepID=A0AAE7CZE2_9GAMM|nr:DMT family transporter [Dickeya zeae]QIZ51757.1 DMT family transporter [Dickeya zeae]
MHVENVKNERNVQRGEERQNRTKGMVFGYIAMAVAVIAWSLFAISIRAIGASPLSVADVALFRFGVPTLLLLPWLPARLRQLSNLRPIEVIAILVGGGIPYFFIASAGGHLTSAAHVAALIAGTSPLAVILLAFLVFRHRASKQQLRAILLILVGVAWMVMPGFNKDMIGGGTLLLLASLLWGAYTLAIRRSGLDTIGCVLLLSIPSTLILLSLMMTGLVESHISNVAWHDMLPFLLIQGLGTGIVSSLSYTVAVQRLGPGQSALIGSLCPALAYLLAVPLLGEHFSLPNVMGVAVITLGVMVANIPVRPSAKA